MRLLSCLVVLVTLGCSPSGRVTETAGPSPEDQELALEIVWEGVYGMQREQRPRITWWVRCGQPTGEPTDPVCADEFSRPGEENLIWNFTTISDTHFSAWLDADRIFIVYDGKPFPASIVAESARLTRAAQDALRDAGL